MKFIFLLTGAALLVALMLFGFGCDREVNYPSANDQVSLSSCFTCHGDDGKILAAQGEWQNSVHASGNNVDYTNRGGGDDCTRCHDHQGFLDYVATGTVHGPYSQVSAIHCFTCHAPHERGNLTLRTDAAYTLENDYVFNHGDANLCATCHHSRISADDIVDSMEVSRYWGPHHGPQSDLLAGSNGYEFSGYTYENSPHAYAVENGCVGCHMGHAETHDGYEVGGHSFNMMYINEESGDTSNLVEICADSACHPSTESYDVDGKQTEIAGLLDSLETLLYDAGIVDENGLPNGLPYPPVGPQLIPDSNVTGALLNFLMVKEDRSMGVHNYKYMAGLLNSSIDYMNSLITFGSSGAPLTIFRSRSSH